MLIEHIESNAFNVTNNKKMPPKKSQDHLMTEQAIDSKSLLENEEPIEELADRPLISIATGEPYGPKIRYVSEKIEEESSDDEPTSENETEMKFIQDEEPKIPSEFWHIQKLIKYIKAGNQTATMISLCLLKDHELNDRYIQKAIKDMGGLEVLINILETTDMNCQIGALSVLLQVVGFEEMRRYLIDLDIVTPLITLLQHPAKDIQVLAAETMAVVGTIRKARKQIRCRGGVPLVLKAMNISDSILQQQYEDLNDVNKELFSVAIGCAKVLDSLCKSIKIREEARKHGLCALVARFLKSRHTPLIIPIIGVVQQCADLNQFRIAFEKLGIIADIVYHLNSDDIKLKENCALAIFKCAVNKMSRDMVREAGGLDPICKMLQDDEVRINKPLLAAVTGAIWKCAMSLENVARFNQNDLIVSLIPLLEEDEDEDVLTNILGALAECCKYPANREVLRANEGLPKLIRLLCTTYEPMLENIPLVIKECAQEKKCMDVINDPEHDLDGVRLVWSLLKHPSNVIKRNACLALVPCIKFANDSSEMVRAFVGGLELTVSLLDNDDTKVLSAVCATIAEIATNPENLGILTDHGVVKKLANLVGTDDEELRASLTLAIAYCSGWGNNNAEFGKLNAVAPLLEYMTSSNKEVLKGACIAAYHLSKDPHNCITMHSCGVVKHVLRLVGSDDPEVQIAAASTIRHIRKLALTAEKFCFKEITTLSETDHVG